MKARPMGFGAVMVPRVLDDSKTQTRRVLKSFQEPAPGAMVTLAPVVDHPGYWGWHTASGLPCIQVEGYRHVRCPYGQIGDQLYISEQIEWLDIKSDGTFGDLKYLADGRIDVVQIPPRVKRPKVGRWPGRTLPIEWARPDRLVIVKERIERVQDIGEDDARAEGIIAPLVTCGPLTAPDPHFCYEEAFAELWDSINKSRGHGWDANDWVWVIEFRRLSWRDAKAAGKKSSGA